MWQAGRESLLGILEKYLLFSMFKCYFYLTSVIDVVSSIPFRVNLLILLESICLLQKWKSGPWMIWIKLSCGWIVKKKKWVVISVSVICVNLIMNVLFFCPFAILSNYMWCLIFRCSYFHIQYYNIFVPYMELTFSWEIASGSFIVMDTIKKECKMRQVLLWMALY